MWFSPVQIRPVCDLLSRTEISSEFVGNGTVSLGMLRVHDLHLDNRRLMPLWNVTARTPL